MDARLDDSVQHVEPLNPLLELFLRPIGSRTTERGLSDIVMQSSFS